MTASRVDFFFSFRSPYSYLAGPRAFALPERFDIELAFRGVIPMIMRGQSVPREKGLHTLRDVDREARRLGMAFGHIHDPVGAGAMRCLRVSEHAIDVGREREFVLAASRAIWGEAVDMASDEGLRGICERAGLAWADCVSALNDPAMLARVEANTDALGELGHWGVPVFSFAGELFWGQDRIEDLEAGARRRGARERLISLSGARDRGAL